MNDPVSHPAHYTSDPSGVECIQIARHRSYAIGNAIKYLWRAGLKESADPFAKQIEDLEKARWYIANEIDRLTTMHTKPAAHRLTEPAVDRYFNGGETMADTVAQNEKLRAKVNAQAHTALEEDDDSETFPERLARIAQRSADWRAENGAVLVEHTGPYRSNVTFLHPIDEGGDAA